MSIKEERNDLIRSTEEAGAKRLSAPLLNGRPYQKTHAFRPENAPETHDKNTASRHNDAPREKERRATKRLEADRAELEKRLLRLEQAEGSRSSRLLKRETRRLSKKQPLDRSSRASSASAEDGSRSSTRLSSMFSISRRSSSRSRPSSVHEADRGPQGQPADPGSRSNLNSNPASGIPQVALKIPERFSTAISEDLTASNALLSYHKEKPLQKPTQVAAASDTNEASRSPQLQDGCAFHGISHGPMTYRTKGYTSTPESLGHKAQEALDGAGDLDRTSFSATLNIEARRSEVVQATKRYSSIMPFLRSALKDSKDSLNPSLDRRNNQPCEMECLSAKPHPHVPMASTQEPWRAIPGGPPNNRHVQRQYRKYKSSPLAVASVSDVASESISIKPTLSESSTRAFLQKVKQRSTEDPALSRPSILRPPSSVYNGSSASNEKVDLHRPVHKERVGDRLTWPSKRFQHTSSDHSQDGKNDLPMTILIDSGKSRNEVTNLHSQASFGHSASAGQRQLKSAPSLNIYFENETSVTRCKRASEALIPKASQAYPAEKPLPLGCSLPSLDDSSHEVLTDDYNTADEGLSIASHSRDDNEIATMHSKSLGFENLMLELGASLPPAREQTPATISDSLPGQVKHTGDPLIHLPGQHVPKVFVICCICGHWHDWPSQIYSRFPRGKVDSTTIDDESLIKKRAEVTNEEKSDSVVLRSELSKHPTSLLCPPGASDRIPAHSCHSCWCGHKMNRSCCQEWSTMVHMRERRH
ncbi:uncharacterized protein BO97DRAFT_247421 [Aspergillus homomorphus CBS 101889]|uniref:Uncharacterized protein n=1 Tax=Aspergillus homomorphus (strain CBS 101889) TaxID=1450537 RepID=A0A395HJ30_ASPHC|nr:hypothetical protein BO97DRAFT_247421 [Aspergillus homomorphus CBS 101889]RAL07539.1 hypothetical protein BO97DRAFT_247421 [Aspergillus homomorphus CBS 101889]